MWLPTSLGLDFILAHIIADCCRMLHVQLFIHTSVCVFFHWKISIFILGKKKQQHRASPSSSVDPGIFVFCQQVSRLNWYHDCFPCNRKYSFLYTVTGTQNTTCPLYVKLCPNNLKLYSINVVQTVNQANHIYAYVEEKHKTLSYPWRSGGIGRGLSKSSLPTNQYVFSIPFP